MICGCAGRFDNRLGAGEVSMSSATIAERHFKAALEQAGAGRLRVRRRALLGEAAPVLRVAVGARRAVGIALPGGKLRSRYRFRLHAPVRHDTIQRRSRHLRSAGSPEARSLGATFQPLAGQGNGESPLRAKRSNPESHKVSLDCFVANAPCNDGRTPSNLHRSRSSI